MILCEREKIYPNKLTLQPEKVCKRDVRHTLRLSGWRCKIGVLRLDGRRLCGQTALCQRLPLRLPPLSINDLIAFVLLCTGIVSSNLAAQAKLCKLGCILLSWRRQEWQRGGQSVVWINTIAVLTKRATIHHASRPKQGRRCKSDN